MNRDPEALDKQYKEDQRWLHSPTPETKTSRESILAVRLRVIELREKARESDPTPARALNAHATGLEDALFLLFGSC